MSNVSDIQITEAMIVYGGGFVSDLGRLFCRADDDNRERLKAAFPEYWARYADLARLGTLASRTSMEKP